MKNLAVTMDLPEQQLLDAAPDALVVANAHGTIVLVNQQAEAMFGYSRDELLGKPVETLLPERHRSDHPRHRDTYLRAPRVRPMSERSNLYGRRKDGTEFAVEIRLSPITLEHGTLVASAIRDATDHLRREQSLTGILEASLDEIYVFDAKTLRFVEVNEGARQNLGYTMEELRRLTPLDIKPELTPEVFERLIRPLRESERAKIEFETVHKRKDGSTYPVEVHMHGSRLESSLVIGAIILDITERKQAEDVMRQSNLELEQRVFERTAELEAAIKESERTNAGKSRFLAAASHDLRQPLQSLGLYLSVMTRQLSQKDRIDPDKLLGISGKIRKSLDTMGNLLDALLDISKLESGVIAPEKRDVHLQEILDRVFTDNVQQAEEKGLRLLRDSEDYIVHSDPALLERVLDNLVTNAVRYTEKGHVSIECERRGNTVRIAVSDTGVGIAADELDKVFEEYYQLDNPVRDLRKGLGLGLSIVKLIGRLLDHPLTVTSTPGQGSTFGVEVPLGSRDSQQAPAPSTMRPARNDRSEPVVLFVDDDPAIVDATTMLLKLSGFEVRSALSGDEAFAHVADGVQPDILVTDYRLPGLNGVEVARRVRQLTGKELPVVLMTGDTSSNEIDAARLSNYSVLHKPVDTDQLISVMELLTS